MPLKDGKTLVKHAAENKYAVAMINTNGADYEIIRAIAEVAEEERSPVMFGAYAANLAYRGHEYAAMVMNMFAEKSSVPMASHLDHSGSAEDCKRAIDAGFTSVMIDGSKKPFAENLAMVKEVCAIAKPKGVSVEAEIGELQRIEEDGSMGEVKNLADPKEVQRISEESDIDMLAVGIGNAHGFYKGEPEIHTELLDEFRKVSEVPLVLHGTTGLSEKIIHECIRLGIAKINLGTQIRTACVKYTADAIENTEHKGHPWKIGVVVKDKLKEEVRDFLKLIGSVGKA